MPDALNSPATTAPALGVTAQDAGFARSSAKPADGLWCLEGRADVRDDGIWLFKTFDKPRDWSSGADGADTLTVSVMVEGTAESVYAAIFRIDADGAVQLGDSYPVGSKWRDVSMDLRWSVGAAKKATNIRAVGVVFWTRKPAADPQESAGMILRTDAWRTSSDRHAYLNSPNNKSGTFYVERQGRQLRVGMVGSYELSLHQTSSIPWKKLPVRDDQQSHGPRGQWHVLTKGLDQTSDVHIGDASRGLMLLDQKNFDLLGEISHTRERQPLDASKISQLTPWLGEEAEYTWQVVWTSPVGAQIEIRQLAGPFDTVGQPRGELLWRLMIYQWGQMFVRVEPRNLKSDVPEPVTWAIMTNGGLSQMREENVQRMLAGMYSREAIATLTEGGALPHEMQNGAPAAMIAKAAVAGAGREKNVFWQKGNSGGAAGLFGVGLPAATRKGPFDCMILLNQTTDLVQAGSFSGYLAPPRLRIRQGEVDRTFPGDNDNDGLVESYGFQVVRLAKGRASFIIDPGKGVGGERAIFYPAVLFTVPAAERDAIDLKNSRLLINVDGKQFTDPPQWPDGSFLLQLPFVLERPVTVEAVVVKKE